MKIELKEKIFIAGCKSLFELRQSLFPKNVIIPFDAKIIYKGKISEIPEEIVKESVDYDRYLGFRKYNIPAHIKIKDWTANWGFTSAKESIQSACPEEYCIIYKTK